MPEFSFTEEDLDEIHGDEGRLEDNIPPSYLAKDIDMEGSMGVKYGLEVAGHFAGDLYSNNKITILPGGKVDGQIEAFDIVVEGNAEVLMTARKRLDILRGGRFVGKLELQPEVIRLSEFAVFGENAEAADSFFKEFTRDRANRIAEAAKNSQASAHEEEIIPEEEIPVQAEEPFENGKDLSGFDADIPEDLDK